MQNNDSFGARATLRVGSRNFEIFRLDALEKAGLNISRLPFSLRILLENMLRHDTGEGDASGDIEALTRWKPDALPSREINFTPAR
ncbi:MAG TPA: hypothetical protein VHG09_02145, partial [Longimicrobiales bacterium]|nr:hypothetical protein [Longimicrobiales bacterium]